MKGNFQIERRTLDHIVQRLAAEVGIDPALLEPGRITWTVERRCRTLGLSDPGAYIALLEQSGAELDYLIDALIIQETRFFRDTQVFDQLRIWALEMKAKRPLRILSAPCSTGQEAYSLAAIVHCAGIPYAGFSIDAFDVSPTALTIARRGLYPAGALEHVPAELQQACGTLSNLHWQMRDELRGCVHFERRNLSQAGALDKEPVYHLILCRNLFIYLHPEARALLAKMLSDALLPGGRLVVGPGDRVAELNALFVPLKPAAGFGLTHKPAYRIAVARPPLREEPSKLPVPRRVLPTSEPDDSAQPVTAAEFYRRAVDCMERGNARGAERRCRQALYLAPAYLPALEMLQSLWHLHPNPRIRRALNARIQRVRMETEGGFAAQRLPERGTR